MAPFSKQTVFGFGCCLDWRPTSFVAELPSIMVCNACGLVPPMLATLPCIHLICAQCYERTGTGSNRCPLDRETFEEKHVVWSSRMDRERLLRRRVRCWNADNGCYAEGVASEMLEHFTRTCRFHVVSCARCRGEVLHVALADHLEWCSSQSASAEQPAHDDNVVNEALELGVAAPRFL
ncbi:uncharacterized protein [Dermacentor andersoni]|uniref:uncharacterized protein n=1 Tax=Dermacentor andersoni TaxID=34620 RepID=UPI0021555727|nr:RING finger protein 151-like [Dermacentor andersoni]